MQCFSPNPCLFFFIWVFRNAGTFDFEDCLGLISQIVLSYGVPVIERVGWQGWPDDWEAEADVWVEGRALARFGWSGTGRRR